MALPPDLPPAQTLSESADDEHTARPAEVAETPGPQALVELEIPGATGPIASAELGINLGAAHDNFPLYGLQLYIPAWPQMGTADSVSVRLDGMEVSKKTIDANEVGQRVTMFIQTERLTPGSHVLAYSLTRLGNIPEPSAETRIFVKLTRPGGKDQDGDNPGHSELHLSLPAPIINDGVDADSAKAGVPVTIAPYPNMSAGDDLRLSWGGEFVHHLVSETQVGNSVEIEVKEAVILARGDSDANGLAVTFEVYDIVQNRSEDWAAETRIVVDTGNSRLGSPLIKEAYDNVLDLETLGNDPVTVQVIALGARQTLAQLTAAWGQPRLQALQRSMGKQTLESLLALKAGFTRGDKIVVKLTGTSAEGNTIVYEAPEVLVVNLPAVYEIPIPNLSVRQLAKTQAVFSYRLVHADASESKSRGAFVNIIGEAMRLAAPIATDAPQGVINPDLPSTSVEVPWDTSMALGDGITLKWIGTRPDKSIYDPPLAPHVISEGEAGSQRSIFFTVQGTHLKAIEGGTLELHYLLQRDLNGAIVTRESARASKLNVGEPIAELPAPLVSNIVDGVMNPGLARATLTVPNYNGKAIGDVVHSLWNGSQSGPRTDSVTVNSFSKPTPIDFTIEGTAIAPNDGGSVEASYWVIRAGDNRRSDSGLTTFKVGLPVVLDPPTLTGLVDSNGQAIADQGSTTDTQVTLSGTAAANQAVELFDGAQSKGQVTANPGGTWVYEFTGLAEGPHALKAKALYGAGAESAVYSFSVIEPFVVISSVKDSKGVEIANGGVTQDTVVTLSGLASPVRRYPRTALPSPARDYWSLALRPLLIGGMVTPVIDGDGGINISILEDNPAGVLCAIDPWTNMQAGDRVEVYWDATQVAEHDVVATDIDQRIFLYLAKDAICEDWAEQVYFSLIRKGTSRAEESVPLRLRVKLSRPAGKDKDPHLPGHSELQAPQLPKDVIENGVDATWAASGIPVTIASYPGRTVRDTLQLNWGSVSLRHTITQAEAAGTAPVIIDVDQATILAAGDSTNLLVHYQVYDEVWNFSEDWSLQTFVAVDAGAWKLDAPIIKESTNGVIDLAIIGSNDVTVQIVATTADFAPGDTATMTWVSTPATGEPIIHQHSIVLASIPAVYETTVPNALIRDTVQGTGQASYVLSKANGQPPKSSKRATARITGVSPLAAPTIMELVGDVLDPELERAHVEIWPYEDMTNGDVIDLVWLGTQLNGIPYIYEAQHIVTANEAGHTLYFAVMAEHIALLENGTLDVSYRVSNDVRQAVRVRVSEHLLAKVGRHAAELPAPIIVEAPDGVLDPVLYPDTVTLLVNYLGTTSGDTLTWYWLGHPLEGSGSDWIPITTVIAGQPIGFTIARSLVENNINDEVKVLYTLKRGTTGKYQYSATLNLTIGKLIGVLPKPDVLQASNAVLDPMAALNGATVRVRYDSMEPQDIITRLWLGTPGNGSPADQQQLGSSNGQVEFTLAASVIGANIGRQVSVSYRVQRYTAQKQSETLHLTVLPFGDPDKDLPHPVLTQANSQTLTLNLATFAGNATATVGKWPFSATGQRVWLRLEGQTSNGGLHTITLLDGSLLTSSQVTAGLSETVLRGELEQLGQDTALVVICNVAFDGTASEATAVAFARTTYTFKLHHDWVSPRIISVKDSKGEVADNGITFDTSVALSGTSTLQAELEILDGTTRLTGMRADGNGMWTANVSGLRVKNYSLSAHALDGSGLVSQPRRFEVVANLTPTITQVVDSSGPISNGGTTVETSITVSGQGSPDQQIELLDGTVAKGKAITNGAGAWSLTVSGLALASHPLKARALYGSQPESTVWTVIVAAAVAPTISSIKDSHGTEIAPNGFTVDTAVVLSGQASANLEVEIFDGAISKGTARANAGGQWTLSLTGLSVTAHGMKARAQYGNNLESAVRNFTVATLVTPSIINALDPNGSAVANGASTFASSLTLSGKASINQSVEIFDGGTSKGTATVNASGDWSRQVNSLATGRHALTAKALYANNPVSSPWTVEVLAATVPAVTSVRDSQKEVANGGRTTDTSVTVKGTAAAKQQVEVFDNTSSKGTVPVNAAGDWTLVVGGLALGGHGIKAIARYGEQPQSNVRTFTVDPKVPDFVLDRSPVSLNGRLYGLAGYPGHAPLSWPAGTTYQRSPSAGVAPYRYSSSNSSTVQVDSTGKIYSVSNGSATITVSDNAGRSGSYTVTVSNVVMVYGLGNATYKTAVNWAAGRGLRIPSLDELRAIYGQYGARFPMGNNHYWSSTGAGLWKNYVKNLVNGEELTFSTKFENMGSFANIVAI